MLGFFIICVIGATDPDKFKKNDNDRNFYVMIDFIAGAIVSGAIVLAGLCLTICFCCYGIIKIVQSYFIRQDYEYTTIDI